MSAARNRHQLHHSDSQLLLHPHPNRPSFPLQSSNNTNTNTSDYSPSGSSTPRRPSHSYSLIETLDNDSTLPDHYYSRSALQSQFQPPPLIRPSATTTGSATRPVTEVDIDALASFTTRYKNGTPSNANAVTSSPATDNNTPDPRPAAPHTNSSSWKLEFRGLNKFVKWVSKGSGSPTGGGAGSAAGDDDGSGSNPRNSNSRARDFKDGRKATSSEHQRKLTKQSQAALAQTIGPAASHSQSQSQSQSMGLFRRPTWARQLSAKDAPITTAPSNAPSIARSSTEQDVAPILPDQVSDFLRGRSLDTSIASLSSGPRAQQSQQTTTFFSSIHPTRPLEPLTPPTNSILLPSSSSKSSTPKLTRIGIVTEQAEDEDASTTRTAKLIKDPASNSTLTLASTSASSAYYSAVYDTPTTATAQQVTILGGNRRHLSDNGDGGGTDRMLASRMVGPQQSQGGERGATSALASSGDPATSSKVEPSSHTSILGIQERSHPWTLSPEVEEDGFELNNATAAGGGGRHTNMRTMTTPGNYIVDLQSMQSTRGSGRSVRSEDSHGQDVMSASASGSGYTGGQGSSNVDRYSHASTAVASSDLGHSAAAASTLVHQTTSELGHGYGYSYGYGSVGGGGGNNGIARAGSGRRPTTAGVARKGSGRRVASPVQRGGSGRKSSSVGGGAGAKQQIAGAAPRRVSPPRSKHVPPSSYGGSTFSQPAAPAKPTSVKDRLFRSISNAARRSPIISRSPSKSINTTGGVDPRLLNKAKRSNASVNTFGNVDGMGRMHKRASQSLLSVAAKSGSRVSLGLGLSADQFKMESPTREERVERVVKVKSEKPPIPTQPPPARLLNRPKSASVSSGSAKVERPLQGGSSGERERESRHRPSTSSDIVAMATFAAGLGLQLEAEAAGVVPASATTAAAATALPRSRRPSLDPLPTEYLITAIAEAPEVPNAKRRKRKLSKRNRGVLMTDHGEDGVVLDIASADEEESVGHTNGNAAGTGGGVLGRLLAGVKGRSTLDLVLKEDDKKSKVTPETTPVDSVSPSTGSTGTSTATRTGSDASTTATSPATSQASPIIPTPTQPIERQGFFRSRSSGRLSAFRLSMHDSLDVAAKEKEKEKEREKDDAGYESENLLAPAKGPAKLRKRSKASLKVFEAGPIITPISVEDAADPYGSLGRSHHSRKRSVSDRSPVPPVPALPHIVSEGPLMKTSIWEELGVSSSRLEESGVDRPVRGPISPIRMEHDPSELPVPPDTRGRHTMADAANQMGDIAPSNYGGVSNASSSQSGSPVGEEVTARPPTPSGALDDCAALYGLPPPSSMVDLSSAGASPSSSTTALGGRTSFKRAPLTSLAYTGRLGYEQEQAARLRRSAHNSPLATITPLSPTSSTGQLHGTTPPVSFPAVVDRQSSVSSRPSSIGHNGAPVSTLLYTSPSSPAVAPKHRVLMYHDTRGRTSFDDLPSREVSQEPRPQTAPLSSPGETLELQESDDAVPPARPRPFKPTLPHRLSSISARRWTLAVNHIADDGDFLKEIDALKRSRDSAEPPSPFSNDAFGDDQDGDDQQRQEGEYDEADGHSGEDDERVWLKARRAMLCVREMIRTESAYRRHLSQVFEMESSLPSPTAPTAFIDHLPILISASFSFSTLLEEDPSAWGVSAAFLSVEDEIERAMVSWCRVVGQVMMELMASSTSSTTPWYTRRVSIRDTPKDTARDAEKEEKKALKRSETAGSSGGSSNGPIMAKFTKREKPPKSANSVPPSSATSPALSAPPTSKPLGIQDVAIMPSQRIPRYVLLFKDLLQQTPITSPSRALVERALEGALRIAKNCDAAQQNEALSAA
ncbi:hypothetical protein FRB95_005597 [Tulasnella sp. JGI-2019a]|nr:hypothetical protein FRB95_005597 [Tulasnella sp. JGI-2019a]